MKRFGNGGLSELDTGDFVSCGLLLAGFKHGMYRSRQILILLSFSTGYWTLDTDTVVEGTWEDTWRHMQENRVTRAFLDFPGARVTGEAMRKQGGKPLKY